MRLVYRLHKWNSIDFPEKDYRFGSEISSCIGFCIRRIKGKLHLLSLKASLAWAALLSNAWHWLRKNWELAVQTTTTTRKAVHSLYLPDDELDTANPEWRRIEYYLLLGFYSTLWSLKDPNICACSFWVLVCIHFQ